jgi:O-succinylbenzoic acid--CoA ligase
VEVVAAPSTEDGVNAVLPRLAAALAGTGPALLPVEAEGYRRDQVLAAARIDEPVGDAALLVPTSGSTGRPRVAALSGTALRFSADATHSVLGGAGRWLLALPTTHIAGLQVLVRSLQSGLPPGVVDTSSGFTVAAFAEAVHRLDVALAELPHYTALVPTQLQRLLDDGEGVEALWQLDAVLLGGAAASPALLERAKDAGVTLVRTYGMTETCGGCVYDGVPLPGVDVTVGADGVVRIAGPVLFDGYRDGGASGLSGGALTTSDLGHWDDAGLLHVDGRLDNVVISGGVNVPAETVERALASVDGIGDVAVVGITDAEWGERVVAVVTGADVPPLESLRGALREQLPDSWLPRQVVRLDALPQLPSGKPDRVALRRLAADLAR